MTERGYRGVDGILMRSALNCKLLEDPNGSIKGQNLRTVIKHPIAHSLTTTLVIRKGAKQDMGPVI